MNLFSDTNCFSDILQDYPIGEEYFRDMDFSKICPSPSVNIETDEAYLDQIMLMKTSADHINNEMIALMVPCSTGVLVIICITPAIASLPYNKEAGPFKSSTRCTLYSSISIPCSSPHC